MGVDAEHRHSVGYLGTCGTSGDSATMPVPPPALRPPVLHAAAPNPVSPPPLLMSCWDPPRDPAASEGLPSTEPPG